MPLVLAKEDELRALVSKILTKDVTGKIAILRAVWERDAGKEIQFPSQRVKLLESEIAAICLHIPEKIDKSNPHMVLYTPQ